MPCFCGTRNMSDPALFYFIQRGFKSSAVWQKPPILSRLLQSVLFLNETNINRQGRNKTFFSLSLLSQMAPERERERKEKTRTAEVFDLNRTTWRQHRKPCPTSFLFFSFFLLFSSWWLVNITVLALFICAAAAPLRVLPFPFFKSDDEWRKPTE